MDIEKLIRQFADKPVFFTTIHYGNPLPFGGHRFRLQEKILLVTGVANATSLKEFLSRHFILVDHLEFRDHHHYTLTDLERIKKIIDPTISIITTEKDMVKLEEEELKSTIAQLPFFYLPIEMEFIKNGEDFDALVEGVLDWNFIFARANVEPTIFIPLFHTYGWGGHCPGATTAAARINDCERLYSTNLRSYHITVFLRRRCLLQPRSVLFHRYSYS